MEERGHSLKWYRRLQQAEPQQMKCKIDRRGLPTQCRRGRAGKGENNRAAGGRAGERHASSASKAWDGWHGVVGCSNSPGLAWRPQQQRHVQLPPEGAGRPPCSTSQEGQPAHVAVHIARQGCLPHSFRRAACRCAPPAVAGRRGGGRWGRAAPPGPAPGQERMEGGRDCKQLLRSGFSR